MRTTVMVFLVSLFTSACGGGGGSGTPSTPADDSGDSDGGGTPPSNGAPSIRGNPDAMILYDDQYEFQPDASDPDGDELTFEIHNKPDWADFDASSGVLSGSPTLANIGAYENIRISVSDGVSSNALPVFSITVVENAPGSVTLSWQPPTQYSDGSPLVDLAGFVIYYGRAPESYDHKIRVENPGLTSYIIENLVPGTYYIAAKSFNSASVESSFSGEVAATID